MLPFLKDHSWLLGVLLLAAALRSFQLSDNPPGFFRDEADKAFSTYSLLQTGNDLSGRPWPLQIQAFKARTSPLYHWFSLPFIGAFGLTVFSTRLLAALAGTTACAAVYLLGKEFAGKTAGLLAALLLAVSPWLLLFSRWANQGIFMTVFIPLAVWGTVRCLSSKNKGWGWMPLSALFWALAWISYAPARLFVPLLMFAVLLVEAVLSHRRKRHAVRTFSIGVATLILIGPFLYDVLSNWEESQHRLEFLLGEERLTLGEFLRNYFLHWDPRYLFLHGDGNPRHHAGLVGQLTPLEGVCLIAGLIGLFRQGGTGRYWLLLWLLLSPVPAALTREGLPHALRTLMMVPAFAIVAGIGLHTVYERLPLPANRKAILISFAILVQTAVTVNALFVRYPADRTVGLAWERGFLESFRTVEKNRREGETCTVTGIVEYPRALAQCAALPDPELIQDGESIPGYRFLPTGTRIDPRVDDSPGLYLDRAGEWEIPKPLTWKKVPPDPAEEEMEGFWRIYRVGEE